MITLIQPIPAGNALRLYITPPPGADRWRVLRRTADVFTGPEDSGAVKVVDGCTDNVVLDATALVNDIVYHYRAYFWVGGAWVDSPTITGTPAATYQGEIIDPAAIIRERLGLGLAVEVKRGVLKPGAKKIPVIPHAYALDGGTTIPCVSVHMDKNASGQRAVGEVVFPDEHLDEGGWIETEGWLVETQVNCVAVSVNSDERSLLRKSMIRVLTANLPVFAEHGMIQFSFNETEYEDFEKENAPLFYASVQVNCIAPFFVQHEVGEITDIVTDISFSG